MLASLGCCNKVSLTGVLKQQEFIFFQFWRLESSRSGHHCGRAFGGLRSLPWLAGRHLLTVSSHGEERALVSFPLLPKTLMPSRGPHPS